VGPCLESFSDLATHLLTLLQIINNQLAFRP
jgi:hypothetical protein